MQINEKWYKLYEKMFGTNFNRLLTIGNRSEGYHNIPIKNLDDVREYIEENFPKNELYISLYNYKTEDNILRWTNSELNNYEKYAEKNCILFRFKQNTDIIQEEVTELTEIQKFMFIRRSINLGSNKTIVEECNKTYNFFKTHFNIKGLMLFNGFDECLLIYYTDEISLKNASLTYYNISELLKEKLELQTLIYENIEPFAQMIPLPGTQNNHSRLYTQLYHSDFNYEQIMQNSQEKFFNEEHLENFETSYQIDEFIKEIDAEINSKHPNEKYNFDKIWDKI